MIIILKVLRCKTQYFSKKYVFVLIFSEKNIREKILSFFAINVNNYKFFMKGKKNILFQ